VWLCKCEVVSTLMHQIMNVSEDAEVQLYTFLTTALVKGEQSAEGLAT
jgi:hypothetical protein